MGLESGRAPLPWSEYFQGHNSLRATQPCGFTVPTFNCTDILTAADVGLFPCLFDGTAFFWIKVLCKQESTTKLKLVQSRRPASIPSDQLSAQTWALN